MNTNALAKLYDRLTPLERLPLIMAATNRGDTAEADRLVRSAPRIDVRMPDYFILGEGLLHLSHIHMIEHLDLVLKFWLGAYIVKTSDGPGADKKEKAEGDRFWSEVRMTAYRICVEADAWRRLCGELKIDPEALFRDLPGYEAMQATEEAARRSAFTPEEAAAYLRQSRGEGTELPTIEKSAKVMRDFINERAAWGGIGGRPLDP